jgi:Mn2+/Fe2+ NRAMP family transporter
MEPVKASDCQDLAIGIVIVVLGAAALMGATAAAFAGIREAEHFTDTAGLAHGIAAYAGRAAGALFAVALPDASVTGRSRCTCPARTSSATCSA